MSFAKDDIGLTNTQAIVQAQTVKTRVVKDSSETSISQTEDLENQERITFSESLDKRLSDDRDSLDQNQEDSTKLDLINDSYTSISDTISDMKKQVNNTITNEVSDNDLQGLNDSIKDKLGNIEEVVKNTTFGGKELFDESSADSVQASNTENNESNIPSEVKDSSLKALGLPEVNNVTIKSKEDAENLAKNLDHASQEVSKRQSKVSNSQNEIQKNMKDLFLTEINLLKDNDSSNNSVEETKNNVISGILDDPSKSVKIQIKSINTDVLIALIKIHA